MKALFLGIAIFALVGVVSPAMANNGNNGCENANPNAKVCEKNPNSEFDLPECTVISIILVEHPITLEQAYSTETTGWTEGDVAEFDSGAKCVVGVISGGTGV